jgi:hypothetical protein
LGLDIYVGPLSRYYAGDWKLITQQAAEAAGIEFRVVRPRNPPADAVTDPSVVHDAVVAWRSALVRGANGLLPSLDWNEAPQADYFTDKPDWDGYWAVQFLAARDEFPDIPAPSRVEPPGRMRNPAKEPLQRRVDEVYRGKSSGGALGRLLGRGRRIEDTRPPRYPHLHLPELWLPADFDRPLGATDLVGKRMTFGSVPRLLGELETLNDRTLHGDAAAIEQWSRAGPPEADRSLEAVAAYGLAILLRAARYGVEHQLPMKMDY